MASIVSTGIGSGLDVSGIVQQLVTAEGAPVEGRLAQREAFAQSKLSAFGSIKSALSDLKSRADAIQSLDSLLTRSATSGDEDAFTVTAESGAAPARYALEVLNVAAAQKLTSGAFADAQTSVGTGTLTVSIAGSSMDLVFDAENSSLSDIRDAINSSPDNPGVSATIVNADAGSYLILTADNTGAANEIMVTQSGGDGGLAALEYDPANFLTSLTESIAADDARIEIDGLLVQSENNTFATAIEGVTIDVLADTAGITQSLVVENDTAATSSAIRSFMNSYNALVELNSNLTSYDQESDVAGALIGDSTLRGIITQVRNEMNRAVTDISGPFTLLSDIGMELQVDGKFEIDSEKLTESLESDYQRVAQLFTNSDGFAVRVFETADTYLASDGILETRTDGLNGQIDNITEQRERLTIRLTSLEERLLRQYNALDSLLGELNNTSNFLASQLQNLPGFTKPGNN